MRLSFKELFAALNFETYQDYLNSVHWREFSASVKQRICYCCSGKRRLQVHHIQYNNLGKETKEDVITVCRECYRSIHRRAGRNASRLQSAHFWLKKKFTDKLKKLERRRKKKRKVSPKRLKRVARREALRETEREISLDRQSIKVLEEFAQYERYLNCIVRNKTQTP